MNFILEGVYLLMAGLFQFDLQSRCHPNDGLCVCRTPHPRYREERGGRHQLYNLRHWLLLQSSQHPHDSSRFLQLQNCIRCPLVAPMGTACMNVVPFTFTLFVRGEYVHTHTHTHTDVCAWMAWHSCGDQETTITVSAFYSIM